MKTIFHFFLYTIALALDIFENIFVAIGNLFKNLFGNNHKKIQEMEDRLNNIDEKFMSPKQIFDKYNNNND